MSDTTMRAELHDRRSYTQINKSGEVHHAVLDVLWRRYGYDAPFEEAHPKTIDIFHSDAEDVLEAIERTHAVISRPVLVLLLTRLGLLADEVGEVRQAAYDQLANDIEAGTRDTIVMDDVRQIGIENHPTLPVEYVDHAEGAGIIDRQAQRYLGISGPEFARRYRAGGFDPCDSAVVRVAMLLPLAGPNYPDDIGRDDWEPCVGECGRAGPVPAAHPALAVYLRPACRASGWRRPMTTTDSRAIHTPTPPAMDDLNLGDLPERLIDLLRVDFGFEIADPRELVAGIIAVVEWDHVIVPNEEWDDVQACFDHGGHRDGVGVDAMSEHEARIQQTVALLSIAESLKIIASSMQAELAASERIEGYLARITREDGATEPDDA